MRFIGTVFRCHNPEWAIDPTSGRGAEIHDGRFNRKGVPALYTALTIAGAIAESMLAGRPLQPTLITACEVDCNDIVDLCDTRVMADHGVTGAQLDCPDWRLTMLSGGEPVSQRLADNLIAEGFAGMIVDSFTTGVGPNRRNLVLWKWSARLPHRITVIDDEDRLPKDRSSWQ